jgi:FAD synthase
MVEALVLEDLAKNGMLESTLSYKKVGYYLGSFDPLHRGHEAIANQVI